ncbi:MAG: hypothetical protein WBP56_25760 [Polyangia bacterium]
MAKSNKTAKTSANRGKARRLATRRSTRFASPSLPQINWDYWKCLPRVYLHEVIALSCGIDPGVVSNPGGFGWPNLDQFDERLRIAERNVRVRKGGFRAKPYPTGVISVYLVEVAKWAVGLAARSSIWKELPDQFRQLAQQATATKPQGLALPGDKSDESAFTRATKPAPQEKPEGPASAGAPKPPIEEKPLKSDTRNCMLKIILGITRAHWSTERNPWELAGQVVRVVKMSGHNVGRSTVDNYLKEAARLPKDFSEAELRTILEAPRGPQ